MYEKILVVTATLGKRDTLQKTIESVRAIGGNKVKHVIIAPSEVLPELRKTYGNLEYLVEPSMKKGIYSALNYVFNIYGHDYDYLTFINDDDYWLPEYKELIDLILSDQSLDFVYGKTKYINEKNEIIGYQTSSSQFYSFLPLALSGIILLTQQATILKSDLFFNLGGFDESYKLVADSKFWIELSLCRPKFRYKSLTCAAYMIQDGQLSSDKKTQKHEQMRLNKEYQKHSNSLIKLYVNFMFRIMNFNVYALRLIRKN